MKCRSAAPYNNLQNPFFLSSSINNSSNSLVLPQILIHYNSWLLRGTARMFVIRFSLMLAYIIQQLLTVHLTCHKWSPARVYIMLHFVYKSVASGLLNKFYCSHFHTLCAYVSCRFKKH